MALSSAKSRLLEPASLRSMFVRVTPIPRSLSDRRAVLRALQKYGEIEVFKRLIDPASFISTTKQSSVVSRLAENSPLQFDVLPEQTDDLTSSPISKQLFKGSPQPSDAPGIPPVSHPPNGPPDGRNTFILHIFPTETYKHKTNIRYSPLHGPWPDEKRSSFVTSALRVVVPKDMAAKGLWDWETGGQSEKTAPRPPEKMDHIQERMQRRESRSRSKGLLGLQSKDGHRGTVAAEDNDLTKTLNNEP